MCRGGSRCARPPDRLVRRHGRQGDPHGHRLRNRQHHGFDGRCRPPPALRGPWVLGTATLVASVAAFVLLLAGLWTSMEEWGSEDVWRTFGCVAVLALAGSHACVMLGALRRGDTDAIRLLSLSSIGFAAFDTLAVILPARGARRPHRRAVAQDLRRSTRAASADLGSAVDPAADAAGGDARAQRQRKRDRNGGRPRLRRDPGRRQDRCAEQRSWQPRSRNPDRGKSPEKPCPERRKLSQARPGRRISACYTPASLGAGNGGFSYGTRDCPHT